MSRSSSTNQNGPTANWGEALLDLGRAMHKQFRRGAGFDDASRRLHTSPFQCELALEFFEAGDLLRLRALVEDWSWQRIARELALGELPCSPRTPSCGNTAEKLALRPRGRLES